MHEMTARKRRSGRPTHAQSDELTQLIVETATQSFVERGFQGTTIQLVAEDCGVTRRSIVSRYKSKDELLIAVALRNMEDYAPQLAAVQIREEHVWEDLESLCRKLWERGTGHKESALLRAYLGEVVRLPHLAEEILKFYHLITQTLEDKFTEMQKYGLFRNYKAATLANTAISLVISNPRVQTMLFDPAFNDAVTVERYFSDIWTMIREMA